MIRILLLLSLLPVGVGYFLYKLRIFFVQANKSNSLPISRISKGATDRIVTNVRWQSKKE